MKNDLSDVLRSGMQRDTSPWVCLPSTTNGKLTMVALWGATIPRTLRMPGSYLIEALANSILAGAEDRKLRIDPLKLQKLMYLTHGYYLGASGNPLVDENFEAWPYGPVASTIYHEFKHFGSSFIPRGRRVLSLTIRDNSEDIDEEEPYLPKSDALARDCINYVLEKYGSRTGVYLSDLTHKVGSPWERMAQRSMRRRGVTIENDEIREYFSTLTS